MTGKELREALRAGRRVYGTMIVSPSPRWLEVIEQLNIDFVFIDTEHIAIDRHQLSWMCHGYSGKGIAPVVRIPAPDPYQACMAMDAGAKGIVAPYIETVEEVQQLRGAVKTRPIKGKKLFDFLNGSKPFEPDLERYIEKNNQNHVLIINIESQASLDNLDELVRVPGLDAVLIGPHDLSCNLGVPEQYDHPVFKKAVEKILMTARKAGVGAGIHVFYNESVKWEIEWAAKGANLILHSGDINRFAQVVHDDISTLRKALDGQSGSEAKEVNI
ncbi:MAG TPA: aldolase/citrate lyase family protein [Bacteroidales bacterium]|nr:aldolase/citrate lyase family protein [Bacteroidales bacterium]